MAGMLLTQLDNFLIGTFVGLTMLGFYDRAYRTAQWPSTLLNAAVGRAAFYTYARLQNDPARLHKSVTMVLWIISGLALPLALSVFVTAPDLLRLLYGDRWLPAAPFLRVLVLVSVVRPLWENAGTLFVAVGKPHLTLRLTLMQAAVLAAAGLPLTLVFGAGGTVAAVALAFLVGVILSYREVNSQLSLDLVGSFGGPLLAAALTIAGYVVLNQLLGFDRPHPSGTCRGQSGLRVCHFLCTGLSVAAAKHSRAGAIPVAPGAAAVLRLPNANPLRCSALLAQHWRSSDSLDRACSSDGLRPRCPRSHAVHARRGLFSSVRGKRPPGQVRGWPVTVQRIGPVGLARLLLQALVRVYGRLRPPNPVFALLLDAAVQPQIARVIQG